MPFIPRGSFPKQVAEEDLANPVPSGKQPEVVVRYSSLTKATVTHLDKKTSEG